MFGSVGNWVLKVTMASTFFLAGLALEFTGFDVQRGANQDPQALYMMRILFSTIPAVASILAFILLLWYPLNEHRMADIRAALEARRGDVSDKNDPMVNQELADSQRGFEILQAPPLAKHERGFEVKPDDEGKNRP
jgi:Na+/melibiose symporter-like transporter